MLACSEHVTETSGSIKNQGISWQAKRLSIWDLCSSGMLRSVPSSRVRHVLENGTDRLSRNVGTELPLYAAQHRRIAYSSFTPRLKPEITWPPVPQGGYSTQLADTRTHHLLACSISSKVDNEVTYQQLIVRSDLKQHKVDCPNSTVRYPNTVTLSATAEHWLTYTSAPHTHW